VCSYLGADFGSLVTDWSTYAPATTKHNSNISDLGWIDQTKLQAAGIDDVKYRVRMMLTCDEEVRLHPQVQATHGGIGEDQTEMVSFTTVLQVFVADKCEVNKFVRIEY
jgi:hypothetical protein